MTARIVEVPGGRLHAIDDGSGPPIVLLHAGIVDSRAWLPLTGRLVAAGYRTVAYDRRGTGHSVTDDVSFSNRDDCRAVMDALGIGRACLVGNSIGGQIAVDVAVETPARVAALVTIGANVGGLEVEPTSAEAELFARMEELEEHGTAEEVTAFDLSVWVDGPGQPDTRVDPDVRALVREMSLAVADRTVEHGRPIPLQPPAVTRLDALTMPVLALAGGLDVSDVAATAHHLAANVPGARAIVWPDIAHLIALEAPDRVAEVIVALLGSLPAWS